MRRILVTTRALNKMFTFDVGKFEEKGYAMWRKMKNGCVKNVHERKCVFILFLFESLTDS